VAVSAEALVAWVADLPDVVADLDLTLLLVVAVSAAVDSVVLVAVLAAAVLD
jgi:hypothetical protein